MLIQNCSAARSALGHHEALLVETHLSDHSPMHSERLKAIAFDLHSATEAVSKLFTDIMHLNIAQHMPIST